MGLFFWMMLVVAGIVCWKIADSSRRKRESSEVAIMANQDSEKERQLGPLRIMHSQHPDIIPAVPKNVGALEFQGWISEANRRLELWAIRHRSSADMALRIQLQKQINDLEDQHLRYGKTRSEQELLEHRHNAEMAKLVRDKEQADDEVQQIKEKAEERAAKRSNEVRGKPDSRSPEQIKLAKLRQLADEEQKAIAECNGDKERIEEVRRIFEPARIRILEDR